MLCRRGFAVVLAGLVVVLAACQSVSQRAGEQTGIAQSVEATVIARGVAVPTRTPAAPQVENSIGSQLELLSFECTSESFGGRTGYAYVEGEVKNISGRRLEDVQAVASWYTQDNDFITSDTALIEFRPIMPGQTSPFKTISTLNPLMANCKIGFKHIFGEPITASLRPTRTPTPTLTPASTRTPRPTSTPGPTTTPVPTRTPAIVQMPEYDAGQFIWNSRGGDVRLEGIVFPLGSGIDKRVTWRVLDSYSIKVAGRASDDIVAITLSSPDGSHAFELNTSEASAEHEFEAVIGEVYVLDVDLTFPNMMWRVELSSR